MFYVYCFEIVLVEVLMANFADLFEFISMLLRLSVVLDSFTEDRLD